MRVLEHGSAVRIVQQDVVIAAALEFNIAQRRAHPVHAVFRISIQHGGDARQALFRAANAVALAHALRRRKADGIGVFHNAGVIQPVNASLLIVKHVGIAIVNALFPAHLRRLEIALCHQHAVLLAYRADANLCVRIPGSYRRIKKRIEHNDSPLIAVVFLRPGRTPVFFVPGLRGTPPSPGQSHRCIRALWARPARRAARAAGAPCPRLHRAPSTLP